MDEIDRRSEQFVGMSREALAAEAQRWPVSEQTPQEVRDLLLDARQLFVGGAVTTAVSRARRCGRCRQQSWR